MQLIFLDDILIIGCGYFGDYLEQESFCFQEEVEYLGCVINREGIKPQSKTIEKMLALKTHRSKTELEVLWELLIINYHR